MIEARSRSEWPSRSRGLSSGTPSWYLSSVWCDRLLLKPSRRKLRSGVQVGSRSVAMSNASMLANCGSPCLSATYKLPEPATSCPAPSRASEGPYSLAVRVARGFHAIFSGWPSSLVVRQCCQQSFPDDLPGTNVRQTPGVSTFGDRSAEPCRAVWDCHARSQGQAEARTKLDRNPACS